MKTIIVKNQEEMDTVPLDFEGRVGIRAQNTDTISVKSSREVYVYGSSRVTAYDSSQVTAYDSSRVTACDSSQVFAHGSSQVFAWDSARVEAFLCASVIMRSASVFVKAYDFVVVRSFVANFQNIARFGDAVTVLQIPENGDAPEHITRETWLERSHIFTDGIQKRFVEKREINGVTVYCCDDGSFVVERDGKSAHGDTVEAAIEDLRYKVREDRDAAAYLGWRVDKDKVLTLEEAIEGYRVITGACEYGVKDFLNKTKIPEIITPYSIDVVTRGHYGNEAFRDFINAETGAEL